jgi:hypothetical protein
MNSHISSHLLLSIMSPRNEVITAIPFHDSYEINKSLIPTGDAEEEDRRLEEEEFSRCKISALLLGLLVGYFIQFSIVGAHLLVVITLSGEDLVAKSKANIVVFSLFRSFFTAAVVIANLIFIRYLVRTMTTYSTVGGRSEDMIEEMVWRIRFGVGVSLTWTTTGALLGMWAQTGVSLVMLVVALVWCKIVVMHFATDNKPSSSRQSSADEIMTAA